MLLITLNAVFAFLFAMGARLAFRRAWPFVRAGYGVIRAEVKKPDFRTNVYSRRLISEASNFLVGGLLWMVIGGGAALCALVFALRALDLQF